MTADSDKTLTPRPAEVRPADEHANLITHGLGFLLSMPASVVLMKLVVNDRTAIEIVACGVYCCSLIGLYAASTCSHLFYDLAWRRFFRTVDQVFIYIHIAGSFTPVAVMFLWQAWWPALLVAMWTLAVLGIALVIRLRSLTPTAQLTYGFLGWLPAISLKALYDAAPFEVFILFVAGGLFYSTGAVFLRFDHHVRYFHALWHTFVISGGICHYIAILLAVV